MLKDLEDFSTDELLAPLISNLVFPLWPTVCPALGTGGQVLLYTQQDIALLPPDQQEGPRGHSYTRTGAMRQPYSGVEQPT